MSYLRCNTIVIITYDEILEDYFKVINVSMMEHLKHKEVFHKYQREIRIVAVFLWVTGSS